MVEFKEFAKIPRLARPCVVTEKIDGTNASIYIGPGEVGDPNILASDHHADRGSVVVKAGSRTRWISPADDNFGFARWVVDNVDILLELGLGHHFGEWWGPGIQRGYGLDTRRFSLFNTSRWFDRHLHPANHGLLLPDSAAWAPHCCHVVPVLYQGPFSTYRIEGQIAVLNHLGSSAAPGFMKPEGVVVYHEASKQYFKKTCEHDDEPKNAHPKKEKVPQTHTKRDPSIGGRRVQCLPYAGQDRRRPT